MSEPPKPASAASAKSQPVRRVGRGVVRAVALASMLAGFVPWLGAAGIALGLLRWEVSMTLTAIAAIADGGIVLAVFAVFCVLLIAAPLLIGIKVLVASGHLMVVHWQGIKSGAPDLSVLRLYALLNGLAALGFVGARRLWPQYAESDQQTLLVMMLCSIAACVLSLLAALLFRLDPKPPSPAS